MSITKEIVVTVIPMSIGIFIGHLGLPWWGSFSAGVFAMAINHLILRRQA